MTQHIQYSSGYTDQVAEKKHVTPGEIIYLKHHMKQLKSCTHPVLSQSKTKFHGYKFFSGLQRAIYQVIHTEKFNLLMSVK